MRKLILTLLSSALCIYSMHAQASNMPDDIKSIAVVADPSLALPLTEIVREYSAQKHISVAISFQSVNRQESEISETEGASYDVIISARPKLLESLKQQGLIDIYSEVVIARNRLVLVAATHNPFQVSFVGGFPLATLINYCQWRPGILVGNPETMIEGTVTREALRNYDVLGDLEPYILYIRELSEMLDLVADEGKLAFIFESDAKQYARLRIIDRLPDSAYDPVAYTAAVLAGDKMDDARQFVDYLKQVQSQKIFASYYFLKP